MMANFWCCSSIMTSSFLLALFFLINTSQSALILPLNSVLTAPESPEADFALPEVIRQELDTQKRSDSSSPLEDESEDLESVAASNDAASPQIPFLSILSGFGQNPQNQCFCCKAFVCRRQPCPCSKFFL